MSEELNQWESAVVNDKGERLDEMILTAHVGPKPGEDWVAWHKNGDPLDCRRENLEWVRLGGSVDG